MGTLGRLVFGPVGDYIEDVIMGDDEDEECDSFAGKCRKVARYLKPSRIPGAPGPIVEPTPNWLSDDSMPGRGLVHAIFDDSVEPFVGSIVCCDLIGLEHSGVYVGRNRIIHRDGDGFLAAVSPSEFIDRLNGFNNAINIFVACDADGDPVGGADIAKAARSALKNPRQRRGYNLLTKNCHQFCRYCVTGEKGNMCNCTCSRLERLLKRELGAAKWIRWDF